jgi:hypothetical protein
MNTANESCPCCMRHNPMVTSEPFVTTHRHKLSDAVVAAATDGLRYVVENQSGCISASIYIVFRFSNQYSCGECLHCWPIFGEKDPRARFTLPLDSCILFQL